MYVKYLMGRAKGLPGKMWNVLLIYLMFLFFRNRIGKCLEIGKPWSIVM